MPNVETIRQQHMQERKHEAQQERDIRDNTTIEGEKEEDRTKEPHETEEQPPLEATQ